MSSQPTASNREVELKLELPAQDFQRLRKSPLIGAFADGTAHKTLRSIYFDSPEHGLQKEGISLRLRNDGGTTWLQTLKTDAELNGGLSSAAEFEAELETCEPDPERIDDKDLKRKIKKALEETGLRPVFETIVDRTTHVLRKENCAFELALDKGRVEANAKKRELREVELELLSGSLQDLMDIAKELFADLRVRPSAFNKAERGYRLLRQEPEVVEPMFARAVELRHGDSARDAFVKIFQSAAEQIVANQRVVLETGAVEGVHQLRVGLTRLRSALRALKPYDSASWIGELESDAQSLARTVGHLRDADVLIADIYTPVAAEANDVPGLAGLLEALKAHREATHKEIVETLAKKPWPRLLLTMTLGPRLIQTGGELDEPIETAAGEIMERRWKKVAKFGARLDSLDLEERHSMRKALKRLRYNSEFFRSLYDRAAQRFIKRLKTMQLLFGSINDMAMAQRLIPIASERRGEDPAPLAAAGYILGRHETAAPHVWKGAKREWKRLEEAAGFWR